ncbi:MAG: 4-hydroxythreonine-4-phosphate dehydrogenase PdxA [Bacteroidota bacterium]
MKPIKENKNQETEASQKPIIGITMGDYNGVGPEVMLKALAHPHITKICTPVIYGSMKIISKYRKTLKVKDFYINQINHAKQIAQRKISLLNVGQNKKLEINPGKVSEDAGSFAYESLKQAVQDVQQGHLQALLTAPINKNNIQSKDFDFPGHTEYLTKTFQIRDSLMMMVCDELKVGVVTGHIPLAEVSNQLTREKVATKILIMLKSLRDDFGIAKPRIAVLGPNPHAGEGGLLGEEENQIIRPVITEIKKKGAFVFGPYPADGFFGTAMFKKFDATLAMYHDQGLVPFKTLAFERGVNFTAGLPIVRTSPDHGTAYDIAGKNVADESSFREALFLAIDIAKRRKELVKIQQEKLSREKLENSREASRKG